jgi:hypothetical protein
VSSLRSRAVNALVVADYQTSITECNNRPSLDGGFYFLYKKCLTKMLKNDTMSVESK